MVIAWGILLAALLSAGDRVRDTIRLSLLFYGVALVLLLRRHRAPARAAWTLAWLAYAIHVAMAFHHIHGWSHAHAYEHVRWASGFGEGIFVSYFFTLLWTLDVFWWWRNPASRERRPRWVGVSLHAFMLFVVFNATVVFETGCIRWAGVAFFEVLARQAMATQGAGNKVEG
jgi:hypothetical protein